MEFRGPQEPLGRDRGIRKRPIRLAPPSDKQVNDDYIIGPSDVLAVSVWKDTELTRTVLVRPDGKISLPLAGELEVSGLTALNVQRLIAQKLKSYISDPQVTVIVQEVKSRTYSVLGKTVHHHTTGQPDYFGRLQRDLHRGGLGLPAVELFMEPERQSHPARQPPQLHHQQRPAF